MGILPSNRHESESHRGSSFFPFSSKFSLPWEEIEWGSILSGAQLITCLQKMRSKLPARERGETVCDQMQKKDQKKKREKVKAQWRIKEGQARPDSPIVPSSLLHVST